MFCIRPLLENVSFEWPQDRSEDLATGKQVRVSPYRLAAHLGTAFVTFSLLVHTGFQVKTVGGGGRFCGSPPVAYCAGFTD